MTFEQIIASAHDALVYVEKKTNGAFDVYVQLHGAYTPDEKQRYYHLSGDFRFLEYQAWDDEKDPASTRNAYEVTSIEQCEDGSFTAYLLGLELSFEVSAVTVENITKRQYFAHGKKLKVF